MRGLGCLLVLLILGTASSAVSNRGHAGRNLAALLPHRLAAEVAASSPSPEVTATSSSSSSATSGNTTIEENALSSRFSNTSKSKVVASNSTNSFLRQETTTTNGTAPQGNATTGTNRTAPATNATGANQTALVNNTDVISDEDRTIPDTKYVMPQELLQRDKSYNFCCCSCGGKNETQVHFAKSAYANRLCGQGFCQFLFPSCNSSGFSWKSHMLMYDEPEVVVKNLINSCWLRAQKDGAHMHLLQRHVSVTKQAVNNATDYLIKTNRD